MAISSRVAQRRLGEALRSKRNGAGQSMDEVASQLGWNKAKVSRIENAKTGITQRDLYVLMELYGVAEEEREVLRSLVNSGRRERWWLTYSDFLTPSYADQIGWENEAARMIEYQPLVFPGLTQTEEYAHSVTVGGAYIQDPDRAEALVEIRLKRQERLRDDNDPLELTAILTQAALMFQFCGRDALRSQLLHLIELSKLPNIRVLIIPFEGERRGAYAGGLIRYDFPEPTSPSIAYLEAIGTSLMRDSKLDLSRYGRIFDHLEAAALSPDDTIELLAQRVEELE